MTVGVGVEVAVGVGEISTIGAAVSGGLHADISKSEPKNKEGIFRNRIAVIPSWKYFLIILGEIIIKIFVRIRIFSGLYFAIRFS